MAVRVVGIYFADGGLFDPHATVRPAKPGEGTDPIYTLSLRNMRFGAEPPPEKDPTWRKNLFVIESQRAVPSGLRSWDFAPGGHVQIFASAAAFERWVKALGILHGYSRAPSVLYEIEADTDREAAEAAWVRFVAGGGHEGDGLRPMEDEARPDPRPPGSEHTP